MNRARFVFSQSCSSFRCVVARRLLIIVLMLSFRSATSPRASTWIDRVRSPLVTAVATSAIARTWFVRFAASRLTLPVRSFHVPAVPGTLAWPPSRPSTPTSRATFVTCSAKTASVSVMLLIVSASAATSPLASTVSRWRRLPVATAVTTFTMPRTWSVRLAAMTLTESVRSFHVPPTSGTTAWPPSLPSVPTSRATRVTSAANDRSWSTIVLIVFFSSRISPFTSTVILRDRSPLRHGRRHFGDVAHLRREVRAHRVHRVGEVFPGARHARHDGLAAEPPSVPTSRATRVTSDAKDRNCSTIVLMVSFSCRISPRTSTVILRDRSPFATAIVTSAMFRTCAVRLPAIWLTLSVRSFHVPATPGTTPGRRACLPCRLRAPRA